MPGFKERLLAMGGLALMIAALLAGCAAEKGETGPSGTAECMKCHTDDFRAADFLLPKQTQFAVSRHNTGDTFLRRGSTSSPACSGCHTTEGYQLRIDTGTPGPVDESSRIGCFACHAPHSNFDFELRKEGATTIALGGVFYDKQNSNTCAMCHQARTPNPTVANPDSAISNSRWGPHHSAQANILIGNGAYQFAGAQAYPTGHPHNSEVPNGCIHCHMGPIPPDNLAGGHTFSVRYESGGDRRINSQQCRTCHAHEGWTDETASEAVEEFQTEFEEGLHELEAMLIGRGWINETTGLVRASANTPLDTLTVEERGALFNYLLLEGDLCFGVHNPSFAWAVLNATIDYLSP